MAKTLGTPMDTSPPSTVGGKPTGSHYSLTKKWQDEVTQYLETPVPAVVVPVSIKSPVKLSAPAFLTGPTNPGTLSLGAWSGAGAATSTFWGSIPVGTGNTIVNVRVYVRGSAATTPTAAKVYHSSNTSTAPVQIGSTQTATGGADVDQVLTFTALNHVAVAGHSYLIQVTTPSLFGTLFGAEVDFA